MKNKILIFALFICLSTILPQGDYNKKNAIPVKPEAGSFEVTNSSFTPGAAANVSPAVFHRNITNNYFRIEREKNTLWNGKYWEEEHFPLKVYIDKEDSKGNYKERYKEYIEYACRVWNSADGEIKFQVVNSSLYADIVFVFYKNLMEKYDDNFLGITNYKTDDDKKIELCTIEIGIMKYKDDYLTDGEVKTTIIHEMGHALGLGHSGNELDIMYPYINPLAPADISFHELSTGDIEAVKSVMKLGRKVQYTIIQN